MVGDIVFYKHTFLVLLNMTKDYLMHFISVSHIHMQFMLVNVTCSFQTRNI